MKNSVKISLIICLLIIAGMIQCFGQQYQKATGDEYVKMDRMKELSFENESAEAKVTINVTDEFNYMIVKTACHLNKGEVVLELFDPEGTKKGHFTVKTGDDIERGISTRVRETATGNMEKSFRKPATGDWIVKIKPVNATGMVAIESTLLFNPRVDMLEHNQIREESISIPK